MSTILNFSMPSSKKEKNDANSRARRHSGTVVISHSKRARKDKDTDTESLLSSASSTNTTVVEPKKCPLRFMMAGMFEADTSGDKQPSGCPLRRVQLWHTIPLCILAIINLLLVIIALLGLASYRIAVGLQVFVLQAAKLELNPGVGKDNPTKMADGLGAPGEK
ncbi:hypothetical protein BJ875DRAFT_195678 [Amylocarpus encephaloides]|uniref:Uncharacterized protein n=1 Tax=Amylocarpus encephaloides TaxID=45428 RepID=A0A9P7YN96_9HELO|nr:hypothetical protein BJ875DRAFT_195678 [Amylocarpus encephaloides]